MATDTNLLGRLTLTLLIGLLALPGIAAQDAKERTAAPPRVMGVPRIDRGAPVPVRTMSPATRLRWFKEFDPDSAEKKLLMVDPSDEARFAQFLAEPNTGIIRLLPLYPQDRVVSAAEPDSYYRPGFNYFAGTYSFSKRKHGNCLSGWQAFPTLGWAELRLKDGILSTAITVDSVGLIVRLGDVPIESVTVESAGASELDKFTPPTDHEAAKNIYANSLGGVKVGNLVYSSRIPANSNTTYVLRSTMRRRADVMIAFRIVRKESDGSVTLVWKKLKGYPKPSWKKKDQK